MLNHVKQRGLTLVELIMVIVVLAIGLGGVVRVMITMNNFSMTPMISWQAAVIGDNVMQLLLSNEFPGFEHCAEVDEKNPVNLCNYVKANGHPISKITASSLLKEMNALKPISEYIVSIEVVPFNQEPHLAQLTVVIENAQTGKTVLSALKAPERSS